MFEFEASSPSILIVSALAIVLIPSPARNCKVPSKATWPCVEVSSLKNIVGFANLLVAIVALAIIEFTTPNALTLNASELTSSEESSTATSNLLPSFVKASPALIWPAPENWDTSKLVVPKVGAPVCVNV